MMRGWLIALLWLALSLAPTHAQRPPGAVDSYGHRVVDSGDAACGLQFVDIDRSGTALNWTASGVDPAADDGGAAIALPQPFEFYGVATSTLVVSTNGYLTFDATLAEEDGGDFSNDAQLPAIPDNAVGRALRAMVYHDDLSGFVSGGSATWQHFALCPRSSEALGDESCTIVQWSDWSAVAGGGDFDFQAVLYHESFEIVFQFDPAGAALGQGTIGIQDATAQVAAQYRPDAPIAAPVAVCIFDPRFPAGGPLADLQLTKTHKFEGEQPPGDVSYSLTLQNLGPSPVQSASLEDALAAGLSDCEWSCMASQGAACPAAGSGAIDIAVDLAPLAWVELTLVCDVAPGSGTIVNSASAATPPSVVDPWLRNNVDSDLLFTVAGRAEQLRLGRADGELELTWEASCLGSDVDYEIYRGPLGSFSDPQPLVCSTSAQLLHRFEMPGASEFYLVVPTNLTFEGSYGESSAGARPAAVAACRPRSVAACP